MKKIKILLDNHGAIPTKAHNEDAGWDIYSPFERVVKAHSSTIIDSGVHIELPKNTVGMLKSKSGLNIKHGIISEGVIDCGYTGPIKVKLYNLSDIDYKVEKWDKITQLVIMPIVNAKLCVTHEFKATNRGDNGFGSSGK